MLGQLTAHAAAAVEDSSALFGISVGDNIYPDGVGSATDPLWATNFERVLGPASPHAALRGLPWVAVLGNHDHHRSAAAQVEYSRRHPASWHLPSPWYHLPLAAPPQAGHEFPTPAVRAAAAALGGVDIWALDSYAKPRAYREQVRWLNESLAASRSRWRFVVAHNPVHSGGSVHGGETGRAQFRRFTLAQRAALEPLLLRHRVHVYFCGDDHTLQVIENGGVLYVVSGAGAGAKDGKPRYHSAKAVRGTLFHGDHFGAVTVHTVTRDGMSTRLVDHTGRTRFEHTLPWRE